MPKSLKILTALAFAGLLSACSTELSPEIQANIERNKAGEATGLTKQAAVELLDQDKVKEIGVTHSGWTLLTLTDGTTVANKAEEIGYPEELLKMCKNCSNVTQWIE